MKGVILQGSSRSKGNTYQVVSYIQQGTGFDIIDLCTKNIHGYDYNYKHADDDFLPLIREVVLKYDVILFATPIYWYTMSGVMKNFFDRITDCIKIEKETGKKLRGKTMGVISCGSDADRKDGFEMPFRESAKYLGMKYLGGVHTWLEDGDIAQIAKDSLDEFIAKKMNVPDFCRQGI